MEVGIGFLPQMCLFLPWSIYPSNSYFALCYGGKTFKKGRKREREIHRESKRRNKGTSLDKGGQIKLSREGWAALPTHPILLDSTTLRVSFNLKNPGV